MPKSRQDAEGRDEKRSIPTGTWRIDPESGGVRRGLKLEKDVLYLLDGKCEDVFWNNERFEFSGKAFRYFQFLVEHFGDTARSHVEIVTDLRMKGEKLIEIFRRSGRMKGKARRHPAYGTLIICDEDGNPCLNCDDIQTLEKSLLLSHLSHPMSHQ